MGYPVVLKQIQPFILHKTEMGAVRLGIRDDEKLEQAFGKMGEDLYLLQKMLPDGVDTIIGGKEGRPVRGCRNVWPWRHFCRSLKGCYRDGCADRREPLPWK